MATSRTFLVSLAASGLLVGGAIAAGTISAGNASAAGDLSAASTPTPTSSAPGQDNGTPPKAPGPGWRGDRPEHGFGGPGDGLRGLAGKGPVLHGEFVTGGQNGSTTTVVVQSGTVTSKSGSQITVQSTDKYTVTWTLNADTIVRTGWAQGAVKDIAAGDTVMVEGTRAGSTTTARLVAERPKNAPQGGRGQGGPGTPAPGTPSTTS
jgi:hypothetical protein